MKVIGAEEVLTEVDNSVDLSVLKEDLKKKLNTDVVVRKENDQILVQRLLID